MQSYDLEYVYELTGLSEPNRKRLINYYAKLPEPTRIEAHKLQTDLIRQKREQYTTIPGSRNSPMPCFSAGSDEDEEPGVSAGHQEGAD